MVLWMSVLLIHHVFFTLTVRMQEWVQEIVPRDWCVWLSHAYFALSYLNAFSVCPQPNFHHLSGLYRCVKHLVVTVLYAWFCRCVKHNIQSWLWAHSTLFLKPTSSDCRGRGLILTTHVISFSMFVWADKTCGWRVLQKHHQLCIKYLWYFYLGHSLHPYPWPVSMKGHTLTTSTGLTIYPVLSSPSIPRHQLFGSVINWHYLTLWSRINE